MKIFIAYEIGGVEKNYLSNSITIDDANLGETLSRKQIYEMLRSANIEVQEDSVISYYNEDQNAYSTLKAKDSIVVTERLKLLLRTLKLPTVAYLMEKISVLENKVEDLTGKLETKEKNIHAKKKMRVASYQTSYAEIDIAMLHASPLAINGEGGLKAVEDPSLDFEAERRKLIECLSRGEIGADVRFEAATVDNFIELLECKPKIIYVSSLSYYKPEPESEFVLAFEQSHESPETGIDIGLVEEINVEKLKKILNNAPQYSQLVIVKGTYSKEMANIFISSGFSCVVAVNDLKDESKTNEFIADFCKHLLKGDSIKKSFDKAEITYGDEDKDVNCCCAHKHKSSCLWIKKLTLSNMNKRHLEHASTICCKIKGALHRHSCQVGYDFLRNYCNGGDLDAFMEDQIKVCCCYPELDHSKLKFSLHYTDESVLDQVLFESHTKSTIEFVCPLPLHLKPPYIEKFTAGRRLEIRDIIKMVSLNRGINVIGPCGIGKTMLLKRTAQYVYERRIFKDGVVYLDFLMRTDIIFLYRFISKTLNLPSFNHYQDLCEVLSKLDVLLILDNIDPLLRQDEKTFLETFEFLMSSTNRPKFIVASQDVLQIPNIQVYQVTELTVSQAKRIIRNFGGNKRMDINSDYFRNRSTAPADILQIAPLLLSGKPEAKSSNMNPLALSMQHLRNTIPDAEHFLKILFYLPSGAYNINLDCLFTGYRLSYGEILEKLRNSGDSQSTWFVHTESNFEFILLRNNVANYLETLPEGNNECVVKVVEHLGVFSRAILKKVLRSHYNIGAAFRSSLFFVNVGLGHDMWAEWKEGSERIINKIYNPEAIFGKFQANFWHYVRVSQLERIFKNELCADVEGALTEITLCSSAVFLLYGKTDDASEMLERGKACCERYGLWKSCNMIKLTQAAILAYDKKQASALKVIGEALKYFEESKCAEGVAESLLLKGILTQDAQVLLECQSIFQENELQTGLARCQLAISELYLSQKINHSETYSNLTSADSVFSNKSLYFLQIRTKLCLSEYYNQLERYVASRDVLVSTFTLVKDHKDRNNEKEVTSQIRKINKTIRKTKKNSLTLMKAFPLVEKTQTETINRAGAICRYSSNFREELHSSLRATKKEICVVMDIASREKLKQAFQKNTTVLHINSEVFSESHLILEKECGMADPISHEDLIRLLGGNLDHGVKLVVLAMPSGKTLGKFFHTKLRVKNVVYFEMPWFPKEGRPIQIYLALESCIQHFTVQFYTNLVNEDPLELAFSKAKVSMEDMLEQKVLEFPDLELNEKPFLKWWDEFARDEPVLLEDPLSDKTMSLIKSEQAYEESCLIELSAIRGPCNIPKTYYDYKTIIGRQVEMYNVISALNETCCVNIFGVEGIGKSEFVTQIGYYLSVRNKYPDGIYLMNLSGKSSLNEVYELFWREGLSSHSSDIDPRTFLFERKMLLILENCDALFSRALPTFHSLLNIFINECKVSLILTSSIHIQVQETFNPRRFALRHLTNSEAYLLLSLESMAFTSQPLKDQDEKNQYNKVIAEVLKDCQGIPKNILKWAPKLKNKKPRNILALIACRKLEDASERMSDISFGSDLLPLELSLKRSNTALQEYNKDDIPKLVSGRSTFYEGVNQRTTEL